MGIRFFMIILIGIYSCSSNGDKKQVINTTNRIITDLKKHDSIDLLTLFVMDDSVSKRDIENNKENINEGYKLAAEYSELDIASYRIRIDTITTSVYSLSVEVPFVDTVTHETKGKITLVFENFLGFNKAQSINVLNFEEINEQYRMHTNNGKFDTTNVEIDTAMILRGIRHSIQAKDH